MANVCLICGNKFYVKRSILSLFTIEKEYICKDCYKKYPISLNFEDITLDKFKVTFITIFKNVFIKDFSCFYLEYGKIFNAIYKKASVPIIFIDSITINDYTLEEIDEITKMFSSDVIILSFIKKSY